jgi:hypothetical protein
MSFKRRGNRSHILRLKNGYLSYGQSLIVGVVETNEKVLEVI